MQGEEDRAVAVIWKTGKDCLEMVNKTEIRHLSLKLKDLKMCQKKLIGLSDKE